MADVSHHKDVKHERDHVKLRFYIAFTLELPDVYTSFDPNKRNIIGLKMYLNEAYGESYGKESYGKYDIHKQYVQ